MKTLPHVLPALVALAALSAQGRGEGALGTLTVRTRSELAAAVAAAVPGTRIEIAKGEYEGGLSFDGLRGTEKRPVVLAAADASEPPVFRGGGAGIHLTDPRHVELRGLTFEGQTGNGLNIDDGGTPDTPAEGVALHGLVVRDVGPSGNRDGIKLSGVVGFRVEGCTIERWGLGGEGIDMVGCSAGTITGCTLRHGAAAQGSGIQTKGGTHDVVIRANRFENAGARAVNVGGSTGLEYFRPPLAAWKGARWEAKDVRVEGNTFDGSQTPVAFVGVDGATFRFNTIHVPGRWALRILQETRAPEFVPSRGVVFEDNVIAFREGSWSEGGVNVGDATAPETFRFARNVWFCIDAPERTRALVRLPAPETDGVHGRDPKFRDAAAGDFRLAPGAKAGADACPK